MAIQKSCSAYVGRAARALVSKARAARPTANVLDRKQPREKKLFWRTLLFFALYCLVLIQLLSFLF
jgi:hypothetical protein